MVQKVWVYAMCFAFTGAGARLVATAETLPTFYRTTRVLVIALAAAAVVAYRPQITSALTRNPALVGFVAWGMVSAAWSASTISTVSTAAGLLAALVVGAILAVLPRDTAARIIIATVSALTAASLILWLLAPRLATISAADAAIGQDLLVGRIAGVFWWNSDLGVVAGLGATLAVALALVNVRPGRLVLLAALNGIAVVLSGSATAQVSTALGVLAALLVFRAHSTGFRAAKVLILSTAMISLPLIWGVDLRAATLAALGKDVTLTGRTAIWEVAFLRLDEFKWTGVGLESYFQPESPHGRELASLLGFNPGHLHQGYFQLVAELGLVGAALVGTAGIVVLVRCVSAIRRKDVSAAPLVAGVVFFAVTNLANNYLLAPHLTFVVFAWAAFGLQSAQPASNGCSPLEDQLVTVDQPMQLRPA